MKTSILHLSFVLLASFSLAGTFSIFAYGQQPPTGQSGSGVGLAACDNPPCVMPSYGPGLSTGQKHPMPTPLTPEQQQARMSSFDMKTCSLPFAFYERNAQSEDAAGHAETAAGWKGYFAKKSGLTTDEAETVKKIAEEYLKEREIRQKNYRDAVLTARSLPHTVRPSRMNTPAIAEAQDAIEDCSPARRPSWSPCLVRARTRALMVIRSTCMTMRGGFLPSRSHNQILTQE